MRVYSRRAKVVLSKKSKEALTKAYDRHADTLYRLALSYLQISDDAQDAVHDVFVKYINTSPDFSDEEHEQAWLIRTTKNRCVDILRRRKIRSYISLDDVSETVSVEFKTGDCDISDTMTCISKLPEKYRAVITLHYLESFSIEEISSILGVSVSAVKMRLLRGRNALKNLMDKEDKYV